MITFSFRQTNVILLLIAALALSAWSIWLTRHTQPLTMIGRSDQPDAYMENIVVTVMNKQGLPSLKIAAPKMTHYADGDTTYITHPRVTVYRQSPEPWYIDSEYAQASHGTEQITFSNNVVIHHPSDIANPNTTMETASLTILPDRQQALTSNAVTITQPDTIIHAVGMLADLNDGTVKLLSQAKGDYVPTS